MTISRNEEEKECVHVHMKHLPHPSYPPIIHGLTRMNSTPLQEPSLNLSLIQLRLGLAQLTFTCVLFGQGSFKRNVRRATRSNDGMVGRLGWPWLPWTGHRLRWHNDWALQMSKPHKKEGKKHTATWFPWTTGQSTAVKEQCNLANKEEQ